MIEQYELTLPRYKRGYHLITSQIEKKIPVLPEKGIINLFIQHTSAVGEPVAVKLKVQEPVVDIAGGVKTQILRYELILNK